MNKLNNIKSFAQISTFLKHINRIYNVKLEKYQLHNIFEKLGIHYLLNYATKVPLKLYKRDDVLYCLHNGSIRREILKLLNHEDLLKSSLVKRKYDYSNNDNGLKTVDLNNISHKETEIKPYYKNNEDDMEKYSEYLINNIYEDNMKKITLNENDIKQMIKETLESVIKNGWKRYASAALKDKTFRKEDFIAHASKLFSMEFFGNPYRQLRVESENGEDIIAIDFNLNLIAVSNIKGKYGESPIKIESVLSIPTKKHDYAEKPQFLSKKAARTYSAIIQSIEDFWNGKETPFDTQRWHEYIYIVTGEKQ